MERPLTIMNPSVHSGSERNIPVKEMLESANAAVPKIGPAEAKAMIAKGDVLVVDVRDAPEVAQSGKIASGRYSCQDG